MAQTTGAFSFVLHSHLPYARLAGRWPHGEEWIHEAASETYLPLLDSLFRLRERGLRFGLTIGLTPILCEQLADPEVAAHLDQFMIDKRRRAAADIQRFTRLGDDERAAIAGWYRDRYDQLVLLLDRLGGNIVGGFRQLQDDGLIEVATGTATHGYLPLMERDSTIHAQLAVGVGSYRQHFGRDPHTVWLPECAYRPAYFEGEGVHHYVRLGLERFLAAAGLRLFFVETHTLEGGEPVGKAAGDAIGPYGVAPRRFVVPHVDRPRNATTFLPYWVASPDVAVLGRNSSTGMQVWSAQHGYPGDFVYREFHKKDATSGLQYWRVSGADVNLGEKLLWHPAAAFARTHDHADHFAGLAEAALAGFAQAHGRAGILAAAYDTELFGHWWFEGVDWLAGVVERLTRNGRVTVSGAGAWVDRNPPDEVLSLAESSWGKGGDHSTWLNDATEWMWPVIHAGERRMEALVARHPQPDGAMTRVLNQTARELLLLQSSDWPFLVTTGQAGEYATERFRSHQQRFEQLAEIGEGCEPSAADMAFVAEVERLDNPFPRIDFRLFGERQGSA